MGDRVLVQFKNESEVSPAIYLHWGGEQAPELIKKCFEYMEGRRNNVAYTAARFTGICHEKTTGNLSLGLLQQTTELTAQDSHGDAGCYVVDLKNETVNAFGGYGTSFALTTEDTTT